MRTIGCPFISEGQRGQAATYRLASLLPTPNSPAVGFVPFPQFPAELCCSPCSAGSLDLPAVVLTLCHCLGCLLLTFSHRQVFFALSIDASGSHGSLSVFSWRFYFPVPSLLAAEPFAPPWFQDVHMAQPDGHHLSGLRSSEMPGNAKLSRKWRGRRFNLGLRLCLWMKITILHGTFKNKAELSKTVQ